jgi:hypothetical protein
MTPLSLIATGIDRLSPGALICVSGAHALPPAGMRQ